MLYIFTLKKNLTAPMAANLMWESIQIDRLQIKKPTRTQTFGNQFGFNPHHTHLFFQNFFCTSPAAVLPCLNSPFYDAQM